MKKLIRELSMIGFAQTVAVASIYRYKEEFVTVLTPGESLSYSGLLILGVFLSSYIILTLARKKRVFFIRATSYLGVFFMNFISYSLLIQGNVEPNEFPLIPLATAFAATTLIIQGKFSDTLKVIGGGGFSSALIILFGPLFPLVFIVLLAIYDIWAVYRGPIKHFFSLNGVSREERGEALKEYTKIYMVNLGEIRVGMGDIISYSCMASLPFKVLGFPVCLLPITSLYIGLLLLRKTIRKGEIAPGLPIPTFFWASVYVPLWILF